MMENIELEVRGMNRPILERKLWITQNDILDQKKEHQGRDHD